MLTRGNAHLDGIVVKVYHDDPDVLEAIQTELGTILRTASESLAAGVPYSRCDS